MPRVLFAWEFGANLGHLAQLLPLAERLRAKGDRITFALRDVTRADEVLGRRGFEYLQAPVWHPRLPRSALAPCSYSEILAHYGYTDGEGLLGMVKAWREIYRLVDPQVVLFDHAPTALLASRGLEAARVLYGDGFCSPPRVSPFPNFRTWESVPRARLEECDARVLDTMNGVLRKLHLRVLDFAHELFDVDEEFLCTFAELDHYPDRADAIYCGSVFARREGAECAWPEGDRKRIYVYLRPEMRAFAPVAEMLNDTNCAVVWFAPGITDKIARRYRKDTLVFSRTPVRLSDVAASADGAVLYGGHGTVSAMLLGGVPLAVFPTHVEQALVARNVAAIGAGTAALRQASAEDMRRALVSVLDDSRYKEKARAFRARYSEHDPQEVGKRIAQRVERYGKVETV